MRMLAAVLFYSLSTSLAHAADLEILVATDEGWAPAVTFADGFDGSPAWPIPAATRSELVQTLESSADGFGLRIFSDAFVSIERLRLTAVLHAAEEQVLDVEGKLKIVGPPTLVAADASLARLDGVRGPTAQLELRAAPSGQTTLGLDGASGTRRARYFTGTTLMAGSFDQLFAATLEPADAPSATQPIEILDLTLVTSSKRTDARPIRPSAQPFGTVQFDLEQRQPLSLDPSKLRGHVIGRGRSLEIFVEAPELAEGQSWTLLVGLESRSTPPPASVPAPWRPSVEPPPVPLFADAMASYAEPFMHLEGPADQRDIRPTMGPGAAAGDVDGDGWLDFYLVGGGGREEERSFTGRLSRQITPAADAVPGQQAMRFETVTPSGLEVPGFGMGALFFDADGDGDLDLYQANYGADFFFANAWGQRQPPFGNVPSADFERDKTGGWSAGLAAGDLDLDGDLDLYITSYLEYDEAAMPDDGELERYSREDPIAMLPFAFPGAANLLLINESETGIHFVDRTEKYGLTDSKGRGMQPIFWDFDSDGDLDLYVANDVSPNRLWRNERIGKDGARGTGFKDVSFSTGMDDPRGGMGVDVGDTDGDGDEDLFLTNWNLEPNALYQNNLRRGKSTRLFNATFRDVVVKAGLAPFGVGTTSWGGVLFDADCDRDLDLFIPNGYTSPDYKHTGICVGQPNQYFTNDGRGRFSDASYEAGPDVTAHLPSRAALAADFDQDGDLDLIVTNNNGPAQLLVNQHRQLEQAGHFLIVRLSSPTKNRFGIGSEVTVVTTNAAGEEERLMRTLLAGKNYLAGNPPELFFGLGERERVLRVEVRWPSGKTSEHGPGSADEVVVLGEPQ